MAEWSKCSADAWEVTADVIVVSSNVTIRKLCSLLIPFYWKDKSNTWAWCKLTTTTLLGWTSSITVVTLWLVWIVSRKIKRKEHWFIFHPELSSEVDIWISGSFDSETFYCSAAQEFIFSWTVLSFRTVTKRDSLDFSNTAGFLNNKDYGLLLPVYYCLVIILLVLTLLWKY